MVTFNSKVLGPASKVIQPVTPASTYQAPQTVYPTYPGSTNFDQPAPQQQAPITGKVEGPWDRFRDKPPSGVSVTYWNEWLDTKNKNTAPGDKETLNFIGANPNWAAAQATKDYSKLSAADRAKYSKSDESFNGTGSAADLLGQILNEAKTTREQNQQFVDQNVLPDLNQQRQAAASASQDDQFALSGLRGAGQTYANDYDKFAKTAGTNTQRANTQASGLFNDLSGTYSDLAASDRGALNDYLGQTQGLLTQLKAQGSDPNDVAAQQAALSQAAGIAGGDLNYDAATYQSNAADVARQQGSFNDLQGAGYGALDYDSQAAKAFADAGDVKNQRAALDAIVKEYEQGGKDQRELLDLSKSRTGVEQTAQERALYELNRRQAEAQTRSSRDAELENQRARGLRSGGAEIASQARTGQQISQDRVLQDMLANAAAVNRAKDYTAMAASQAGQLRAADQGALGLRSNLSTALRNASFDEAYKRGVGADTASANNQSTRLGGLTSAAGVANAMRSASDNVGLTNAGFQNQAMANNQQTMFGGAQLQGSMANSIRSANDTIRMFQDTYAQNEAQRVGNVANQRLGNTTQVNAGIGQRASDLNSQGQTMVNSNYSRDSDALGALATAADKQYSTDADYYKNFADVGQRNYERTAGITGASTNIAGTRAGITSGGSAAVTAALMAALGQNSVNEAKKIYGA